MKAQPPPPPPPSLLHPSLPLPYSLNVMPTLAISIMLVHPRTHARRGSRDPDVQVDDLLPLLPLSRSLTHRPKKLLYKLD